MAKRPKFDSISMSENEGICVQQSTFDSWNLGSQIGCKVENNKVVEVWCKTCAKHANRIMRNLRGSARSAAEKYITGTRFVTKHTVKRHLSKNYHAMGVEFEKLDTVKVQAKDAGQTSNEAGGTTSPDGGIEATDSDHTAAGQLKQPRINVALNKQAEEAYRLLLKTAYMIAVDGQPLTVFKTLVRVQKSNGIKLIEGVENSDKAREFVHFIAQAVRKKLSAILRSANVYSVLSDGSQARKTNTEKELILARVARDGESIFYCIALMDIDDYGDATADNLKLSIDDAFCNNLEIPKDEYTKKLIAATSDGASVNTGKYNGLLTQLKQDGRPWLITIHCVSHRMELALQKSMGKDFHEIKELMVTIYYYFKRSGKAKRHFKDTAAALDVHTYNFSKVHGTRFINHQRKGLSRLIYNWVVFAQGLENSLSNSKVQNAKVLGILKKLRNYSLLRKCCAYLDILQIVSTLSLCFEKDNLQPFEINPLLEKTKSKLQELIQDDYKEVTAQEFKLGNGETENEITCKRAKKGHTRRKEYNREYVEVVYGNMRNISNTIDATVKTLTSNVILAIQNSLDERFVSFNLSDLTLMTWLDPANWNPIDSKDEILKLNEFAEHFSVPLANGGFISSKMPSEWRDLKHTVKHFYSGINAKSLWNRILVYRRKEFPNICLLAEIVMAIGVSNSVVEAGFSHLTSMLTDRRLSMRHDTMEDLLLIKINNFVWTPNEREEILKMALDEYTSTRRKSKIDNTEFKDMFDKSSKYNQSTDTTIEVSDGNTDDDHNSDADTLSCDGSVIDLVDMISDGSDLDQDCSLMQMEQS